MIKQINDKHTEYKYQCVNCGQRNMYPNIANGFVKGFKCAICGEVNHPIRNLLTQNIKVKEKPMEVFNKTLKSIPPLIIMGNMEFIVCDSGDDAHTWLKPKLIRNSSALIISDPDGSLLDYYDKTLKRNGYKIKVLNTSDFTKSARYNPFSYILNEADIAKLVTALMRGTKGKGKPGDYSFIAAETNLLMALASYVYSEAMEFERNFNSLIEMLESMEIHKEYRDFKNAVDLMFEEKEKWEPVHLSVTRYNYFKWSGKNKKQIVDSCTERLTPLKTTEMRDFLSDDELGLDELGLSELFAPKTALFVIAGETSEDYKFIAPLMYSQLFNILYKETVI